jgi:predicted Zn finger-like uncharacterized protein
MPIIVTCPTCAGQLRVGDDLIGRRVRCPACESTFEASAARPPAAPPAPEPAEPWKQIDLTLSSEPPAVGQLPPAAPGAPLTGAVEIDLDREDPPPQPAPAPRRADRDEERPSRRPRPDEEDDRRRCPACGARNDREARRCFSCDERLGGRSRRDRRDEEDDDDLGIRRRVRRDGEPHRGGLILTFGIISIASLLPTCGVLSPIAIGLGIAAWLMGHSDLRKIKEGSMDPDGQGSTQAGYVCGIIGTILNLLLILACGAYFALVAIVAANAANQGMNNRPPFAAPPANRMKKF